MIETGAWHPAKDDLAAFDAGELPEGLWAQVEEHVAHCPACCQRLEQLPTDSLSAQLHAIAEPTASFPASPRGDSERTPPLCSGEEAKAATPLELLKHPRYRILGLLGAGGMGTVFKAEHRLMERVVALKVMRKSLLNRATAVTQFRQEVRMAARLCHPNIVTAHDADQAGDVHFLVMEYVAGASLDRVVEERGPLPAAEACDHVRQAALGLQHAFEQGMVHRDIKPHNLMRTPEGVVKILDFGLARFASEVAAGDGGPLGKAVLGTPDYMAPEQALSPQQADTRADIYSLGCTLYFLLTGRVPFPAHSPQQTLAAHLEQTVPSVDTFRPDLPPGLSGVLERMLAKDPGRRYETPAEVARALAACIPAGQSGEESARPSKRSKPLIRTRGRWAAVGVAALLTATVVFTVVFAMAIRPGGTQGPSALSTERVGEENKTPAEPPPSPAAQPLAVEPAPPRPDVHERLVAWLKENNVFGPEHNFVREQADRVDQPLIQGKGFELSIGGGLLKSGKPTLLTTHSGKLFILEYSTAQARAQRLAAKGVIVRETVGYHSPIRTAPLAELSELRIDGAENLDPRQRVTGTLAYRVLGEGTGNFALRMCSHAGKKGVTGYQYIKGGALPEKNGSLSFSFPEVDASDSATVTAIPVFLDLLLLAEPFRPNKATVVSNTLVRMVIVKPR
jgi:serine/threonine protein kinase